MRYRLIILLFLVAHGCTCGANSGGGCEPMRTLAIKQIAPVEGAVTGPDQKFGFLATDSNDDPETLVGALRIDSGSWIACQYSSDPDQVIDRRSPAFRAEEFAFRCPVTGAMLSVGSHTYEYSVDSADYDGTARKTTHAIHDNLAPVLSASIKKAPGQYTITYQVSADEDFTVVSLYVNHVLVTTTYEREGIMVIDSSIRGKGGSIEVRAYDRVGNFASSPLVLQ